MRLRRPFNLAALDSLVSNEGLKLTLKFGHDGIGQFPFLLLLRNASIRGHQARDLVNARPVCQAQGFVC